MRHAELISTGAELLSGRSLNRHAQTLARALAGTDLALIRDTTLPDDAAAIAGALREALTRADVVFISGGLGPTGDDVTRQAVAAVAQQPLVTDAAALAHIRALCQARGNACTPDRESQAQIVAGARALSNRVGAAPGEELVLDNRRVFLLPGPPREFLTLLTDHIVPWVRATRGAEPMPTQCLLMVSGRGESDISECLAADGLVAEGVEVAYCAAPGRVELRFTGLVAAAVEATAARAVAQLGGAVYARERLELAEVLGRELAARGLTLAVAESCTGGGLGARLTAVPGSSAYFLGGVVAYANGLKERLLGVPPEVLAAQGAVSAATAEAMARGVRDRCGADLSLAVTGLAGPDGGTAEKPVGLVFFAVADARSCHTASRQFSGDRETIQESAAQQALYLAWRRLQEYQEAKEST
ncbi:MAG: CinA family nicotinamide mononucleotide deamidase-related protein [Candidatus Marinimicrobia bacterium]|nr:CinA family nicotinamide mononucleotide deamidase-related protein [Candidatus Neomarinimicrobiota bacterium]